MDASSLIVCQLAPAVFVDSHDSEQWQLKMSCGRFGRAAKLGARAEICAEQAHRSWSEKHQLRSRTQIPYGIEHIMVNRRG